MQQPQDDPPPIPPRSIEALLQASRAIAAELSLRSVLTQIVRGARELAGARFAALGVLRPDGQGIEEFITDGMDDDVRAAIGDPPRGLGILGELIRHPQPLRLADLSRHPASAGFPPNHPPMTTFLGVPIRTRGEVYGNLYMTEKLTGLAFTEEDGAIVELFAAQAGVAIENARLFAAVSEREQHMAELAERLGHDTDELSARLNALEAIGELAVVIAAEASPPGVLQAITNTARRLTGAKAAFISLADGSDATMLVSAASGLVPADVFGRSLPVTSKVARIFQRQRAEVVEDLTQDAEVDQALQLRLGVRSAAYVPFGPPGAVQGVLWVASARAAGISAESLPLLEILGALTSAGLTNARRYESSVRAEAGVRALLEMARRVVTLHETADPLQPALTDMVRLMRCDGAAIMLIDAAGHLSVAVSSGVDRGGDVDDPSSCARMSMERGETVIARGSQAVLALRGGVRPAVVVAAPIAGGEGVLGVVEALYATHRDLSQAESELLEGLARFLGIGLENARLSRRAASTAVAEERDRIAVELHDGVIQTLFGTGLRVQAAQGLLTTDPGRAGSELQAVEEDLGRCIRDIRRQIYRLEHVGQHADLPGRLQELAAEFGDTGFPVVATIAGDVHVEDGWLVDELTAYAKEALSNAHRHSGARRATLACRRDGNTLQLVVTDRGRGFDPEEIVPGSGLANLSRRAERLGGRSWVTATPGKGTEVGISVPLA